MSYDVGGLGLAGDKSGKRKTYMYVGIAVVVIVIIVVASDRAAIIRDRRSGSLIPPSFEVYPS